MYGFLKHTHLTLILIAVVFFLLNFYWLQTNHKNALKPVFKKVLLHINLTIFVVGAGLVWLLQINPYDTAGFWVLEKAVAFAVYLMLVKTALNENKPKKLQYISFLGALGWIAYIAKLAMTKQAILLVG